MQGQRIWVVGVGAIGSVVSGRLRSDPPCRLIDAWPDHVEAIRTRGLEVEYHDETVRVDLPAYHATELERIGEQPDVVLLAVKSNFTAESIERLRPYLTDDSIVVSLQNGINEEAISSLIGQSRTIGAAVGVGGELLGPGKAKVAGDRITVGELDGSLTPRVEALAELLRPSTGTAVTDNIWGYLWAKLVINTQLNAICAVTGLRTDAIVADEHMRRVALLLGKETVAVAVALGIDLYRDYLGGEPEAYLQGFEDERMQAVERRFVEGWQNASARPSLMQDVDRGRPTEIDYLNGYVVEKGRVVGIPTPASEAIVRLTKQVEQHGRRPIEETRAELEAVYAALV